MKTCMTVSHHKAFAIIWSFHVALDEPYSYLYLHSQWPESTFWPICPVLDLSLHLISTLRMRGSTMSGISKKSKVLEKSRERETRRRGEWGKRNAKTAPRDLHIFLHHQRHQLLLYLCLLLTSSIRVHRRPLFLPLISLPSLHHRHRHRHRHVS